jgi:hypothetical protein
MKTTRTWWATFAGAAVVASVGVAGFAGCGTTTNNNLNTGGGTSGEGESCTRTFDCKTGLACLQNFCVAEAVQVTDGGVEGGEGGTVVIQTGPHLGGLNESCQVSADCASPLACLGNSCQPASYNLTATGKSCTGECNAPADCCELPTNFNADFFTSDTVVDGGFVEHVLPNSSAALRCEDIRSYIVDLSYCSPAYTLNNTYLAKACFDYNTFCQCAANTWACTNSQCVFGAPCSNTPNTLTACPTETRGGRGLGSLCNVPGASTTGTCSTGCSVASDCNNKSIPTGNTSHTCLVAEGGAGDCTCYQSTCYFKCTKDIDCASGSTCDATTSLCKKSGCATNADCIQSLGNAEAQCVTGVCQLGCKTDVECNPPSTVCSNGVCTAAGCSSDANCTSTNHMFCVTAPTTSSPYSSAVTN